MTTWVLGVGILRATAALTAATVSMAVGLDFGLQTLIGGTRPALEVWLSTSIMVPLLITPPIGLLVISMAYELAEAKAALSDVALSDPLTGIANRRFFVSQAEIEIARARRTGAPLSLLVVDIDHFKEINDTYGHAVGDQVLQSVVAVCLGALRTGDTLSRLGGDEFVALLPGTSDAVASGVAQDLCDLVEQLSLRAIGPRTGVTLSIGIATLQPGVSDWHGLLEAADRNLYLAKGAGRNRAISADPGAIRNAS